MRKLLGLTFIAAASLSLIGCGGDDAEDVRLIQECVNRGGNPIYSEDKWGYVYYIACDMP